MKHFNQTLAFLAIFALFFTSCSKEENQGLKDDPTQAQLSFGAILNDLASERSSDKSHTSFLDGVPECSDEAPAYVMVVLSQNGNDVVGSQDNPYKVNLVNGQIFTEEDANLELEPGTYSLDYFAVHGASDEMIWLAPYGNGEDLSAFVDNSLPMNIELGAGVKKYVEVDVLCYDNRMVNEYGYLFFEIDQNKAIEFCMFGNFCDETGRHFPAAYSVNVWNYSNGNKGEQLYSDVSSSVEMNEDGDYAASPVCFALPDNEGMDEYYFEITMRNSEAYGDVEEKIIRAGVITDEDVKDLMRGENEVEYYHFRVGNCGDMGDMPELLNSDIYGVDLSSLNDSGVNGFASLILDGNKLTVNVDAYGLEPNMVHPQHIHGLEDNTNAICPPASADTNGDGIIDLTEGAPFYGPILLPLYLPVDEFPVADASGEIHYMRTFTLGETENEEEGEVISREALLPLVNRVIVLHGMTVDGEYVATLPVACGQIESIFMANE